MDKRHPPKTVRIVNQPHGPLPPGLKGQVVVEVQMFGEWEPDQGVCPERPQSSCLSMLRSRVL